MADTLVWTAEKPTQEGWYLVSPVLTLTNAPMELVKVEIGDDGSHDYWRGKLAVRVPWRYSGLVDEVPGRYMWAGPIAMPGPTTRPTPVSQPRTGPEQGPLSK